MVACAGAGCAGTRPRAHGRRDRSSRASSPAGMTVAAHVTGGIGSPFSVLFLLRVIAQSCESEVDSLMKSAPLCGRGFPPCAVA